MLEIMIGIWSVSFCLSLIVTGINFYSTRKRLQSERLKTLNFNLEKAHLFWSNTNGDFAPITPEAVETDRAKTLRNTLLIGFLGLGSAIGFIFLLVVVLSLNILARSRKEIATFRSPLATDKALTPSEVEALVGTLRQIL